MTGVVVSCEIFAHNDASRKRISVAQCGSSTSTMSVAWSNLTGCTWAATASPTRSFHAPNTPRTLAASSEPSDASSLDNCPDKVTVGGSSSGLWLVIQPRSLSSWCVLREIVPRSTANHWVMRGDEGSACALVTIICW